MKYIAKYLSLALLFSKSGLLGSCCPTSNAGNTAGACAPVRTSFVPITVGQNLYTQYHKLLFPEGFEEYEIYDDCSACSWATDFSVTYRFIQSKNSSQIANALWGSNTLTFAGSQNQSDTGASKALIAEYYGMGPGTNASITLCPRLRNQVVDFQLAISGAKFWAQINLPVTWAKWSPTQNCGAPTVQGTYDSSNLDGDSVTLNYPTAGGASIAGQTFIAGATNYFYGPENTTPTTSFVDALNANDYINVDTENAEIVPQLVTFNGTAVGAPGQQVGTVTMGLYGAFDANNATEMVGSTSATFSTAEVPAAPTLTKALNGYTFGMVQARNNNLFNFNTCGKWGLADIPLMVGYDFWKSDAHHLGAYLKFVIPTGSKIDKCFLQYVLTPVIGNGRHFEFGIGLTGHTNVWVCDTSSLGIYADGYIDYMYGACQTRTFDLAGQPMSRYALTYPLTGDSENGYSVGDTMVAVGDVNLYQGNVTATRGEFMLDVIWACRNFEVGLGYAFTGQTAESIDCGSCTTNNNGSMYALVGSAQQQSFGVGPVAPAVLNDGLISFATYAAPNAPTNFYYLGPTNMASDVPAGENAAYTYGNDASVDEAAFNLPAVQGNCSGLMSGQVLNKIFGHIDYVWRDCSWQPEIGIVGSYGFVPNSKVTAQYWDLGARIGFAF